MNPRKRARKRVFISYSHKDEEWLKRLHIHLAPIARKYGVDIWDDTRIKSGSMWQEEIEEAIKCARVAVLLVSADFLASEFITTEELPPLLEAAQEEGARILSVILSPCGFLRHPILSKFQSVNNPSEPIESMRRDKQEAVFDKVSVDIENILKSRLSLRSSRRGGRDAAVITKTDENILTRQQTSSAPREGESPERTQDEIRPIPSKGFAEDKVRKNTGRLREKIFSRRPIAAIFLTLLIGVCAVLLWGLNYFSNKPIGQASTSAPISANQVKVTVQKGDTANIFDNTLSINLKETEFEEGSNKYRVIALVSSPDKLPLVIKDKDEPGVITYRYPQIGRCKIWVLSSDTNRAEFLVELTGN